MRVLIGIVLGFWGGFFLAALMNAAHNADNISDRDSTSFTADD